PGGSLPVDRLTGHRTRHSCAGPRSHHESEPGSAGRTQMTTKSDPGKRKGKSLAGLQRFGRSLMLPIATLPAAGLLLRLGQDDMLGRWQATEDVAKVLAADRKITRLNSSHVKSSYAVFCLKKKQ